MLMAYACATTRAEKVMPAAAFLIVPDTLNAAGGSISIESVPGLGTIVVVHLPNGMPNKNGKTSI